MFLIAFFIVWDCAQAYDTTSIKDDNDLAEELREHTGKLEDMEIRLKNLESRLEDSLKKIAVVYEESRKAKYKSIIANNSPENIIKEAEEMAENNNRSNAIELLELFVQQNSKGPKSIYVGMMLYHIGNYYVQQNDYENAKEKYTEGYRQNPRGKKAKETLEKLAECHEKLGEKKEQEIILRKLEQHST
jgi:TolA-binding protein